MKGYVGCMDLRGKGDCGYSSCCCVCIGCAETCSRSSRSTREESKQCTRARLLKSAVQEDQDEEELTTSELATLLAASQTSKIDRA